MVHIYSARLTDGQTYDVQTPNHHENHSDTDFRRHLLDIIKSSVSGVVSGTVVHFLYKGRK
jgi:hypothetical protein